MFGHPGSEALLPTIPQIHQIDAPAGGFHLPSGGKISGTGRQAQTTMDAGVQQVAGQSRDFQAGDIQQFVRLIVQFSSPRFVSCLKFNITQPEDSCIKTDRIWP